MSKVIMYINLYKKTNNVLALIKQGLCNLINNIIEEIKVIKVIRNIVTKIGSSIVTKTRNPCRNNVITKVGKAKIAIFNVKHVVQRKTILQI